MGGNGRRKKSKLIREGTSYPLSHFCPMLAMPQAICYLWISLQNLAPFPREIQQGKGTLLVPKNGLQHLGLSIVCVCVRAGVVGTVHTSGFVYI